MRLLGHVLPVPYDLVGADEDEAVDSQSQLEWIGLQIEVSGALVFGRWGTLLRVVGGVDET